MTNEELERAVKWLTSRIGVDADWPTVMVNRSDLRALLSERSELLADVERMRGDLATGFVPPAVAHLWEHQKQLDADGVMVGVSRQALDETLQKHLALIDVLTFCRDSMVAYGDGACGRNCEAMTDGPQFADEIASINAILVDQLRPDRSPTPTTDAANLAEALAWVLPLAKGYAAGRDVSANQRIIQNAEEILARAALTTASTEQGERG